MELTVALISEKTCMWGGEVFSRTSAFASLSMIYLVQYRCLFFFKKFIFVCRNSYGWQRAVEDADNFWDVHRTRSEVVG